MKVVWVGISENSESPVEIPPPTALKKVTIDLETSTRGIFIFST